jgi:hypothetical protein
MKDTRTSPAHREHSNDALLGSILVIEATLRIMITQWAQGEPAEARGTMVADLRRTVEDLLRNGPLTTRYGTGEQEIMDGRQDTLDAIFSKMEGPYA